MYNRLMQKVPTLDKKLRTDVELLASTAPTMTAVGSGANQKSPEGEPKTEWFSLCIASSLTFLAALQFTIYFSSLWPYLLQLQPDATESFFGWINAMYSLGQAIMCPLFGYMAQKMGQNRLPIIIGVTIQTLGNVIYLTCPMGLLKPQWVMFLARSVTGIGAGVITVLRNYAVVGSTTADRSRAISLNMGAFSMGLTLGPALQMLLSPLGYPGIRLFGQLYLDMYSAPAILGILMNGVSILMVIFCFRESNVGLHKKVETENESHARFYALPSYDKMAIMICIACRFAQMFVITNLEVVGPPLTMTMFNWNKAETVWYNSVMHSGFGAIGLVLYTMDIIFNFGKRINHRIGTIVGLLALAFYHVITFPWWGLPGKISYQEEWIELNGTMIRNPEPLGCRPSFEWCKDVPAINQWVYIVSYIVICGPAFSVITVSMNTVFSKIIGPRNQGTMTGLLLLSGCVARIVGPVFVSNIFQLFGPRPAWVLEVMLTGGVALLWIIFYKRMVPLKTADKYSAGDVYKNKHGSVYKF